MDDRASVLQLKQLGSTSRRATSSCQPSYRGGSACETQRSVGPLEEDSDGTSALQLKQPMVSCCNLRQCTLANTEVLMGNLGNIVFEKTGGCLVLRDAVVAGTVVIREFSGASLVIDDGTAISEEVKMERGTGSLCITGGADIAEYVSADGPRSVTVCGRGSAGAVGKTRRAPSLKISGAVGDIMMDAPPGTLSDIVIGGSKGRVQIVNTVSPTSSVHIYDCRNFVSVRGSFNLDNVRVPLASLLIENINLNSIHLGRLAMGDARIMGHFPAPLFSLTVEDCSTDKGSLDIAQVTGPVILSRVVGSAWIEDCTAAVIFGGSGPDLRVSQCLGPVELFNNNIESVSLIEIGLGGITMAGNKGKQLQCDQNFGLVTDLGLLPLACNTFFKKEGFMCRNLRSCYSSS